MGSSLQRLEVLLVGLVIVIAGMVVAVLLVLRPPAPATYMQTTPQPIALGVAQPTQASIAALVATSAPLVSAPSQPRDAPLTEPLASPHVTVPSSVTAAWPWLLLAVSVSGLALVVVRRRTRRLGYTNQSVQQLFAASDRVTHASNMQIVRDLAERRLLTPELAAATGIDTAPKQHWIRRLLHPCLPQLILPCLTWLKVRLLSVSISSLRLPQRLSRAITHNHTAARISEVVREQQHAAMPVADPPAIVAVAASAANAEVAPSTPVAPARNLDVATLEMQAIDLPEAALPMALTVEATVDDWTAEDRALAIAGVLAEIWAAHALQSLILALDTPSTTGSGQVVVTIDVHPDEAEWIGGLPDRIVEGCPTWRAVWRDNLLEVIVATDGVRPPAGGPLMFPALAHRRGNKLLRFYPLAAWRHLGLYGGSALGVLHAILGSVLFAQPPTNIALTILDAGEITPLYREVPHLVAPPGSARETLELLAQAIRRGVRSDVCPLLLVVVEPDDTLLTMLLGIVAHLQARPTTPVHLIIVQEQLRSAGRELYSLLPALLTSGGRGPATLLPGQSGWPKRGEARLVGRGMRVEGREICLDEAAIAMQLTQLRERPGTFPPMLCDDTAIGLGKPTAVRVVEATEAALIIGEEPQDGVALTSHPEVIEESHATADNTAQRQRIISVMTAHRQALMDADIAPAAAVPLTPATAMPPVLDEAPVEPPPVEATGTITPVADLLTMLAGAPDAPDDALTPAPDVVAPASDATAPAHTYLATEAVVESAPNILDDHHDAAHVRPHSRRAALLLATIDAGAAASMPASIPPAHRHEPYTAMPPPQSASASPPAVPAPMVEPNNGWPIGPAPLGRIAMADLLARVVATPAIVAGQANELGVTKNRIVDLLKGTHKAQAKELAEILLVWFDLAGLMVEPTKPGRLRHPRALVTTNLTEIAARLNTTACPDMGTVKRMWAESNEGKS